MNDIKLSGLTNEQKIKDAIDLLFYNLSKYSNAPLPITCGGPEGRQSVKIYYSETKSFWWGTQLESNRHQYWNPVGFDYPDPKVINRSDCEFNCALKGISGHAGSFGKDNKGNVYLLHSGKAGGNTLGTTIEAFCEFYKGVDRFKVLVEGEIHYLFIVSDINSNDLLDNIVKFAKAIFDFKEILKSNRNNNK